MRGSSRAACLALAVSAVGVFAIAPDHAARADDAATLASRDGGVETMSLDALGAEYRRLRKIRGHMSGGAGQWIDEVDSAGGKKERVMGELGRRLDGGTTRARVLALMGPPDRVVHAGDPLWSLTERAPKDCGAPVREVLVYFWRGTHDFLMFDIDGARVSGSHWYAAYE